MTAPRRNIELKASDPDPKRSIEICQELKAQDEGTLWQRDTYFDVRAGRLKLRVQNPGKAQLIQYERADEARQRESRYRIVEIEDPTTLLSALDEALGVTVTVTKRRHLFLWKNVRIHIDEVENLGTFIELEAVAPPESDLSREQELISDLREALRITDDRLVPRGYAALLATNGVSDQAAPARRAG